MNKKIFIAMSLVFLMTISSVSAINVEIKPEENLVKECISLTDTNEFDYSYHFSTFGPVGPIRYMISEVTIEGNFSGMEKIQRLLNRPILRFTTYLPFGIVIIDEEINFTIYYKKDLRDASRFSYNTMYGNLSINTTTQEPIIDIFNSTFIHNDMHKVEVKGFMGVFMLSRAKFHQKSIFLPKQKIFSLGQFFVPSHFLLSGMCKNITEIPLTE